MKGGSTMFGDHHPVALRAHRILADLGQIEEQLRALSDDLWLAIDHNDPSALDAGVAFKREYNQRMIDLNRATSALSDLIHQFTSTSGAAPQQPRDRVARSTRVLDPRQPHTIDEDFTYKQPQGFNLAGIVVDDMRTWQQVYREILALLAHRDPTTYAGLPDNPLFISARGSRDFARDPDQLRIPHDLGDGLFIETNLSAEGIVKRIGRLLDAFGISRDQLTIYLRKDRAAGDA